MERLIFAIGMLVGINALACVDVSGKYYDLNTTNHSRYEFVQTACKSIKLIRYDDQSSTPKYQTEWITDGIPREIVDSNYPDMVYAQQIQFVDQKLIFDSSSFDKKTGHFKIFTRSEITLESSGALLIVRFIAHDTNGRIVDQFVNYYQKN